MYQVHSIKAFSDNYIWALQGKDNYCAIVDPGDAKPVIAYLESKKLALTEILLTHHHPDHVGGVKELKDAFPACQIFGPDTPRFKPFTTGLKPGQSITLKATNTSFDVIDLSGHTCDHIGFIDTNNAFVGDTLFSIGCGRLFEGTAEQMFNSLNKLKGLKDNISVYCAHEYTLANIEFASAVEPNNPALLEYQQSVKSGLAQGQGSIPTNIKREKALNPFLRVDQKIIKLTLQQKFQLKELPTEVESFALLRQWKDKF